MLKAIRRLFKKNTVEVSPDYQKWRDGIFTVVGEQAGVSSDQPDRVYGVIMDVGLADEQGRPAEANLVITETAFASGESSLQTSFGGGIIGLGGAAEVAEHAEQIVHLAHPLFNMTTPANNHDLPLSGQLYFYFLTTTGTRVYKCKLDDIHSQEHPFNEIFARFTHIKRYADEFMDKYSKRD